MNDETEPKRHVVRIELEYAVDDGKDFEEANEYAEFLLAPILATLDTLGMTPKKVEMFNAEDGDYTELLQEDIQVMNDCGELEDDDDDQS
jgi:hypothetical protein